MKLEYNVNDDILAITLKDEPLSYGEEISGNIIAHYSDKDELVEIEILDANKFLRIKEEIIIPEKPQFKKKGNGSVFNLFFSWLFSFLLYILYLKLLLHFLSQDAKNAFL